MDVDPSPLPFRPLVASALYTAIERGLAADAQAARALGGQVFPVCTSIVAASHGTVTHVTDIPTDDVLAQAEHLFEADLPQGAPNAAKVGIVSHPATVAGLFKLLGERLDGPFVLDLTLSGPSGEDLIGTRGLEALVKRLDQPDLVTLRAVDAQLIAEMEIHSLDDAQVAVQRLHLRGARQVLLRCGRLPARFFDGAGDDEPPFAQDLYYDGEEFALFEAPWLELPHVSGASSAFTLSLLDALTQKQPVAQALQAAKRYVSHSLYLSKQGDHGFFPQYVRRDQAKTEEGA